MEKEEEKSVESKLIEIEPQSEATKPTGEDEKPADDTQKAEETKKEEDTKVEAAEEEKKEPENDEDATKVEEKRLLESEPHKLENIEEAKEESLIEIDAPKVEVKLNKSDEKQVEVEIGELAKDIENKIDDNNSLKKSKSSEKIKFGEDDKNEKKPPSPKHHHHHHGILHAHSNEPHTNLHPEFVDLPTSDNEGDVKKPLLVRRNTIVEETEESLRQARKSIAESASRKSSIKQDWGEIKRDLYNREYREFLSRDCLAWFKLSLFYFIFYVCLAGFFILLLYLFYEFKIDPKTPNLFYKESVMNFREINPGLGFRPQVDIESELINVSEKEAKNNIQSLNLFLTKYDRNKAKNFTGAHGRKQTFNYEEIIKNTPCSRENEYGYHTKSPCVIVKLNRIYGWLPTASAKTPANLTKVFIIQLAEFSESSDYL